MTCFLKVPLWSDSWKNCSRFPEKIFKTTSEMEYNFYVLKPGSLQKLRCCQRFSMMVQYIRTTVLSSLSISKNKIAFQSWQTNVDIWVAYVVLVVWLLFWLAHVLSLLDREKLGLWLSHETSKLASYRNQSIDLQSKSIDWFLYDANFDV